MEIIWEVVIQYSSYVFLTSIEWFMLDRED